MRTVHALPVVLGQSHASVPVDRAIGAGLSLKKAKATGAGSGQDGMLGLRGFNINPAPSVAT